MKSCPKCGKEIDDKAIVCISCGAPLKVKKSIFKKWWFWLIIAIVIIVIGNSAGGSDEDNSSVSGDTQSQVSTQSKQEISYEVVDLQAMIDELSDNAMKAEKTYQDKYVEVTGKIAAFDSDGGYITIEPVQADEWNFDTVMCYIMSDEQEQVLMEKSKGDTVVIKGQITSIGEVLGYSIEIDDVV